MRLGLTDWYSVKSSIMCLQLFLFVTGKRLLPCQAAIHPFLASDFPFRYLLPQQGDKLTGLSLFY